MSDDPDLKPCPLCGWSPQLATSFGEPVVGCVNRSCDLCDTEWFDVDAWNTRPIEDTLRARAEAAEAALATARAEGAAAERAAVVAWLRRTAVDISPVGLPDGELTCITDDIAEGRHVRLVEGV
jgi:hypothetical protein